MAKLDQAVYMTNTIWIGYDPRETAAFAVARNSLKQRASRNYLINGLVLKSISDYKRPIELRPSLVDRPIMWDVVSNAPMSTEHANARFFVPHLTRKMGRRSGWALFMDGDMLVRSDITPVFSTLDPDIALYCVKHNHIVAGKSSVKMDGQIQTAYGRKNWSSFMIFNLDHSANDTLNDLDMLNALPGRDLHRFCWLADDEIGELPAAYNYLVGVSPKQDDPKVVHFTLGPPDMRGYENCEFADEWREELLKWAQ